MHRYRHPQFSVAGVRQCRKVIAHGMLAVALTVAMCVIAPSARAASVTVYAAASLKESVDQIAKLYSAQTGGKITISYGASSALARQIENGAPADLFMSADLDWMDYLEQRKLIDAATRKSLLQNQLVLIAPVSQPLTLKIAPRFPLARALGADKLAMANPDAVPAGKYGKAALEKMGVWDSVSRQVARADNVRAALVLVSRGEAPLGIVYRTDALADPKVMIVDTFPADSHTPIVYPVALTAAGAQSANAAATKKFLAFMQGASAQAVWQQYGFRLVPQQGQ